MREVLLVVVVISTSGKSPGNAYVCPCVCQNQKNQIQKQNRKGAPGANLFIGSSLLLTYDPQGD